MARICKNSSIAIAGGRNGALRAVLSRNPTHPAGVRLRQILDARRGKEKERHLSMKLLRRLANASAAPRPCL